MCDGNITNHFDPPLMCQVVLPWIKQGIAWNSLDNDNNNNENDNDDDNNNNNCNPYFTRVTQRVL